jgi:hypothetical protein
MEYILKVSTKVGSVSGYNCITTIGTFETMEDARDAAVADKETRKGDPSYAVTIKIIV